MPSLRVASPPSQPTMVFDGDCRFCRAWIARWQQTSGERVEYVQFQDPRVAARFPELPRSCFEQSVQLIEPDGRVYGGAEAVFRALASGQTPRRTPGLLWAYENNSDFASLAEWAYRVVARHRRAAWFVTRCLWGPNVERPSYVLTRWLFLRLLAVIYFVAFVSVWTQVDGLLGSRGIMPAGQWMEAVRRQIGVRFDLLPTLFWFRPTDGFLHLLCAGGTVASLLVLSGILPAPALAVLWLFYLSLVAVGEPFLSFQWDALLLETGFLSILFAPWQIAPRYSQATLPSKTGLWLLRWLLFRLMFQSGCVKLLSGDATWWNLTALSFHYETQPLPTWLGWYAHQLPAWFQQWSVAVMFVIELGVPFLIFLPRRPRLVAFAALVGLQVLIALTGNYCFFNLLAIALCVLLLDDRCLGRLLPDRLCTWLGTASSSAQRPSEPRLKRIVVAVLASVILLLSGCQLLGMFAGGGAVPVPCLRLLRGVAPFEVVNRYGLFAVMTTSRPEIIIEGSDDGKTWQAYEFIYKAGNLTRRPRFVAPHQPRLDWQMWFAALGDHRQNPWFRSLLVRLLEGSPEVLGLFATNPFPDRTPRHVRAVLYDYRFTDWATRKTTGQWWKREPKGLYCPVLSRKGPAEGSMLRAAPPSPSVEP